MHFALGRHSRFRHQTSNDGCRGCWQKVAAQRCRSATSSRYLVQVLVGGRCSDYPPRIAAQRYPVQYEYCDQQLNSHCSSGTCRYLVPLRGGLETRAKKSSSGDCPTGHSALPPRCVSCTESSWLQIAAQLQGMVEIGGREWPQLDADEQGREKKKRIECQWWVTDVLGATLEGSWRALGGLGAGLTPNMDDVERTYSPPQRWAGDAFCPQLLFAS